MAEQQKAVIQVRDLYKVYKVGDTKVRALNGVNFEIFRGEFCAIVGASGSGKSTLLNMLAGLEKPTKGSIVIAGEHIEKKTENELVAFRREHIGFIFFHSLPPPYWLVEDRLLSIPARIPQSWQVLQSLLRLWADVPQLVLMQADRFSTL